MSKKKEQVLEFSYDECNLICIALECTMNNIEPFMDTIDAEDYRAVFSLHQKVQAILDAQEIKVEGSLH